MMCESTLERGDQLSCRWSVESCDYTSSSSPQRGDTWTEEVIGTFCHGYPDIEVEFRHSSQVCM